MEENAQSTILEGEVIGIRFGLATHKEISTASVSDCPISHSSQLTNPFLGLPLEFGKCESCGTSEPGKCEGHFGYIELPIPIFHPSHINELKRMLSLLCLKCLKLKKFPAKSNGVAQQLMSCCAEVSHVSIKDIKASDGACFLQLKLPSKMRLKENFWNFLERYGFRYGDNFTRTLLPCEVMEMLKRIPMDTRKKLARKGYFPQDGYIVKYLPVPPNCLSVPEISDGVSVMSSDLSISMLKKVLKQVEIIKSSRSGPPNFESHEVEAIDLQTAVDQYLQVRGTAKASRDVGDRFGIHKESNESSTKAWLEKMRTLFIRKGSGFSSRSVITGDAYKRVNEIGIPFEIAQRITFEERVNVHNVKYLQELVDNRLCLLYRDGSSTYSLREGSKGHTFLRPGQIVHRRIMDGDTVFINRPPTTHKHSLQALSVYVHDDHTVKINPLICGPLSADFDGDCIHLFYPQSLAAKAEVMELFSIEKQLLSSHSGNLNLQLTTDSLLSLKMMFKEYFLDRAVAQQLAMFVSSSLPLPALWKDNTTGPMWTAMQILQTALPSQFDCIGEKYWISKGDIVKIDFSRDIVQAIINDVVISIFFEKGPDAVFKFFNSLQPLLMENLFVEGFSVGLEDLYLPRAALEIINHDFKVISPLLSQLRTTYNELVELQLENHIRHSKLPVSEFIMKLSSLGYLIDYKSESAMTKVVQQIGFLGLQISDRGKFYSKTLVEDMASHFESKYPSDVVDYPSAQHGLIQSCFFHGLDPYEEMVHSISTREVIVRSSRGLSEPGTLFKNLMAILRDVVICYDGTVRNVCSNSIIQFEYGVKAGIKAQSLFPAGEPVGVLAATAMSNPAYKAVLDSSPSSNSSWEMMKEILLSRVNFKNDLNDRRIILYFNDCACGGNYCQEKASYMVKNHLEKVILKDIAECFMIEYKRQQTIGDVCLIGHLHLKKMKLQDLNVSLEVIHQKCIETIKSFGKKKKIGTLFRRVDVSFSECCSFQQPCADELFGLPCLMLFWQDSNDIDVERITHFIADMICPVLLATIIKGDHRISSANIIWVSPDTTAWIRNPSKTQNGELALDIVVDKRAVKQSGDAWRIVLDSCLPVLHLIDTTRSTPYAIKQVQELLGISCAFDQAVQRLSTSVSMVTKGVLKEHLILLANSMTCAGNLVGFNSGGYKALSHSLDIQVPFTEATLFRPRKCFERAAEKCHVDNLSSIVASCSWGKHVAVGTGSRFDVLWDQKEVSLNQEGGINVYEFLNMVRSGANGVESVTACLGTEVDDLMLDEEIDDWNLSPEHNFGSDKPMFEDSGWDSVAAPLTEPDKEVSSPGWVLPNAGSNDGYERQLEWGKSKSPEASHGWGLSKAVTDDSDKEQQWGKPKSSQVSQGWCSPKESVKAANSQWNSGGSDGIERQQPCHKPKPPEASHGWDSSEAVNDDPQSKQQWGKSKSSDASHGWGLSKTMSDDSDKEQHWGKPKLSQVSEGWCSPKESVKAANSQWNSGGSDGIERQQPWHKPKPPEASHGWDSSEAVNDDTQSKLQWGKSKSPEASHIWGLSKTVSDNSDKEQQWAKPKSSQVSQGWCPPKESVKAANSQWNSGGSDGIERLQPWHKPKPPEASHGWGSSEALNDDTQSKQQWGKSKSPEASHGWGLSKTVSDDSDKEQQWGKPKSSQVSQGWCSPKESVEAAANSQWNSGGSDGIGRQQPWQKPKPPEASRGWGSSEVVKDDTQSKQQWGKPKSSEVSQGWRSPKDSGKAESSQWGSEPWGKPKAPEASHGWGSFEAVNDDSEQQCGKPKSSEVSQGWCLPKDSVEPESSRWDSNTSERGKPLQGWGSHKESGDAVSSKGWGLPNAGASNETESQQWGEQSKEFKKNRPEGSRGWGTNNGEWKGKSRPAKSRGTFNDDSGVGAMFTATRQRLDMFTSEEQDILSEVEPLMLSIRRIMHQSGYNDGDALSAADQSYILDNVFNHHPDKAAKMGASIDHLMVSKHSVFAESRCFYVVSSDGSKHDFSYRKCLENLVKAKYPDLASEFIEKYFTKPRPRGKQQQNRDMEKPGDDSQLQISTPLETGDDSRIGNEN